MAECQFCGRKIDTEKFVKNTKNTKNKYRRIYDKLFNFNTFCKKNIIKPDINETCMPEIANKCIIPLFL